MTTRWGVLAAALTAATQGCGYERNLYRPGDTWPDADGGTGGTGGSGAGGATGGSGGSGGTAGVATIGGLGTDTTLPPDRAFLDDPALWREVPGTTFLQPRCRLYQLIDGQRVPLPDPVWSACPEGNGCEQITPPTMASADKWWPTSPGVDQRRVESPDAVYFHRQFSTQSARARYELAYPQRVMPTVAPPTVAWMARSLAGSPYQPCSLGLSRFDTHTFSVTGDGVGDGVADLFYLLARYDVADRAWKWAQPPVLVGPFWAYADLHYPLVSIRFGRGPAYIADDPSSSEYRLLDQSYSGTLHAAEGDLGLWEAEVTPGRQGLRGWSPDGSGARTVVSQMPGLTCAVALSASFIVGASGDAERPNDCFSLSNVRFWRTPRRTADDATSVTLGPVLPYPIGTSPSTMRASRTHLVVQVSHITDGGRVTSLLVVRLGDWKTWEFTPGLPSRLTHVYSVSDTHLFFTEERLGDAPDSYRRLVRIDLAQLDAHFTSL